MPFVSKQPRRNTHCTCLKYPERVQVINPLGLGEESSSAHVWNKDDKDLPSRQNKQLLRRQKRETLEFTAVRNSAGTGLQAKGQQTVSRPAAKVTPIPWSCTHGRWGWGKLSEPSSEGKKPGIFI